MSHPPSFNKQLGLLAILFKITIMIKIEVKCRHKKKHPHNSLSIQMKHVHQSRLVSSKIQISTLKLLARVNYKISYLTFKYQKAKSK